MELEFPGRKELYDAAIEMQRVTDYHAAQGSELGAKVGETCRNRGISESSYYKRKLACGDMDAARFKQLKELQGENYLSLSLCQA